MNYLIIIHWVLIGYHPTDCWYGDPGVYIRRQGYKMYMFNYYLQNIIDVISYSQD